MRSQSMKPQTVCILGAGNMGTALAVLLGNNGHIVRLHTIEHEVATGINAGRENRKYLPGIKIPPSVRAVEDYRSAVSGARYVIFAVPSKFIPEVAGKVSGFAQASAVLVNIAKGIDENGSLMTELLERHVPKCRKNLVALSGPSIANELARGTLTAVTIASRNASILRTTRELFASNHFRVYTSDDIVGTQMGGFLKNVIAIAAGMCDGLAEGGNYKAAVIAIGFEEAALLAVRMGAKPSTLLGLAGVGDLVDTCFSKDSRNRHLGELLASGKSLQQAANVIGQVTEGVPATKMAMKLARKHKLELPLIRELYGVLYKNKTPRQAFTDFFKHRYHESPW